MTAEIPEPWASAMVRARCIDPRSGTPSLSALARALGVHTSTVSKMVMGGRATKPETVMKAAELLGSEVYEWLGQAPRKPFEPHPDASLLDDKQREAVNEMIRLLAAPAAARDARSEAAAFVGLQARLHAGEDPDQILRESMATLADDDRLSILIDLVDATKKVRAKRVARYMHGDDDLSQAARTEESAGKAEDAASRERGEESQDPGGMEPS